MRAYERDEFACLSKAERSALKNLATHITLRSRAPFVVIRDVSQVDLYLLNKQLDFSHGQSAKKNSHNNVRYDLSGFARTTISYTAGHNND